MNGKRTPFLACAAALVFLVGLSYAEERERRKGPSQEERDERYLGQLKRRLELTEEQQEQIRALLQEDTSRMEELQAQRRSIQEEVRTLRQNRDEKIRAVLTEEQQTKFRGRGSGMERYRKRREKMGEGRKGSDAAPEPAEGKE